MTCAQALPLLSVYFDGELDVTKSLDIEGHVRECERCAAVWKQHEALRASLRAAALAFAPPPGLELRLRSALRREAPGVRASVPARARSLFAHPPWRWTAVPLAAALAAVLSWSVASHRAGTSAEVPVLAELVSGHVRSLMVDHLVDVATSDQHTVKPWFNGKVDFAPPAADFTASGFPLIGGRVDYIAGRPVAVLVYKRRQHIINVFIWPAPSSETAEGHEVALQGYHLLRWSKAGLTFWAVSDVSSAELASLAALCQEAA